MANNVVTATFNGATEIVADSRYQYDYGQTLVFADLNLPEAYEVHFSNKSSGGTTITQIGNDEGVTIPDQFLSTGGTVYAWVFLHEGEDDGETMYRVAIPVKRRPQPSDDQPTPSEQSAITQAIAALNVAVEEANESAERAALSEANASDSEENASASEENALAYANRAESARDRAVTAEGNALDSEIKARTYKNEAASYASEAYVSAERAEQAANTAGYLDVEIVNGRLIYTRTDQVDVDFKLSGGHLIMEAI